MIEDRKQSASRDWLRAMQRTTAATKQQSRVFARLLDELGEIYGDRIALIDPNRSMTYRQLAERVNRYARFAVLNRIRKGDCVALIMPNSVDYIAAWSGISSIGGIVALINTNLRGKALAHSLAITAAKLVIVSRGLLDNYLSAKQQLDTSPDLWIHDGTASGLSSIDDALKSLDGHAVNNEERGDTTLADRALYIFTSGTTGLPKAANVSHGRIIEWSTWFAGLLNTTHDDRMYDCLPMYHSVGGIVAPGCVLVSGGTVVLREKFSARQFWDDIEQHKCTLFQYIGDLCRYLTAAAPHPRETSHRLRACCGNGLRGEVWEALQSRFNIPRILEFYAATEGSFSLYNVEGKPGAIGRLTGIMAKMSPVELVQFDPDTGLPARSADGLCVRCGHGEIGEALGRLKTRGYRFEGYTDDSESEQKIVRDVLAPGDAWFRTGDLMWRDKAGFFYFSDRVGDTFRWKGENVSTLEVSNALLSYSGVTNATVYGVKVPGHDGRAGMAAIEVDKNFSESGLYHYLADLIPAYAIPMFIRIVAKIDSTETMKPKKKKLIADGFDPTLINDRLLVANNTEKLYIQMKLEQYAQLTASGVAA